jgi:hypothetical protein
MPPADPLGPGPSESEPAPEAPAQTEARRRAAESRLEADPARLADGWERRFVIEGPRAADLVRLYESLGFEVVADPVRAEDAAEDCNDCRVVALLDFRMIYTRVKRAGGAGGAGAT